jgi:hypothetical protein
VDQEKLDSDEYAMVLPICTSCRADGKKVKTTDPANSGSKKCSAASGTKRTAQEAQLLDEQRQAQKKTVPERNAGEDVVEAVVGKMKRGGKKFIHWSKQDGGDYPKDTCTWESMQEDCDSTLLLNHTARFKMGQSVFQGRIVSHESGSKYWVEFQSRRHKDRVVDLELPRSVASGEYSWWRLDGYDTLSEREEEDDGLDDVDESEGECELEDEDEQESDGN